MRIAITCFNLSWQSGGPRLIFSAAQALKKKGHEITIYTQEFNRKYFLDLWSDLDIRIVSVSNVSVGYRFGGIIGWIFNKIVKERETKKIAEAIAHAIPADIDILNVHDFAYPVAYFYKKINPKTQIIWTNNDPPFSYLPKDSWIKNILSRLFNAYKEIQSKKYLACIDKVLVLDSFNYEWCEKHGLRPYLTRLGVDPKFQLPVKDITDKFKEKKVRLFGLGSLNKYRRYEDIILAVKYLRESGIDATARIIANDMWDESVCRNGLVKLVQDNKLTEYITFNFAGVTDEELREVYNESDVFVYPMYLPAPRNGFGFSIGVFEAMAAGLPVVLCRTTTSCEVLTDRKDALFVDPQSPEAIADAVESIVYDSELYRTIASNGQDLVLYGGNLTWDRYVDIFMQVVEQSVIMCNHEGKGSALRQALWNVSSYAVGERFGRKCRICGSVRYFIRGS